MRKLDKKKEREIIELYNHGKHLTLIETSRQMQVPYSVVYTCTRLKERGFNSISKYLNFRAEEKGYKNAYEYDKDRIKEKYSQTLHQRKNDLATQLGFESRYERNKIRDLEKRLGPEESAGLSIKEKREILLKEKNKE